MSIKRPIFHMISSVPFMSLFLFIDRKNRIVARKTKIKIKICFWVQSFLLSPFFICLETDNAWPPELSLKSQTRIKTSHKFSIRWTFEGRNKNSEQILHPKRKHFVDKLLFLDQYPDRQ